MPRTKQFDEEEVLAKAMELYWSKGYNATSIQDLVKHLGVNRASLYETFGDKKKLFDRAFQRYIDTQTIWLKAFLDEREKVVEGFRSLFQLAIEEAYKDKERKGCFVVNTATELLPADDDALKAVLIRNRDTFEKIFYNHLKKGEASGEIPTGKDLKAISGLLFTLYNGLRVISKYSPDREGLLASVDAAISLLD